MDRGLAEAAHALAGVAFATITGQRSPRRNPRAWGRRRSYDPPAEWREALRRISARTDRYSWLELVWLAGEPWAPIERWCLYQMVPRRLTPPWIAEWLDGPNPRSMGYWSTKSMEWVSTAPPISELQWQLWREHDAYGQRWWMIQGPGGGHRAQLSDFETKLVQVRGYTGPWPEPGDLDYAPFDSRVIERIKPFDKMEGYRLMAEFAERSPEQLDSEDHDTAALMRQELSRWLHGQIEDAVASSPSLAPSDLPVAAEGYMSDADLVDEDFIHDV